MNTTTTLYRESFKNGFGIGEDLAKGFSMYECTIFSETQKADAEGKRPELRAWHRGIAAAFLKKAKALADG